MNKVVAYGILIFAALLVFVSISWLVNLFRTLRQGKHGDRDERRQMIIEKSATVAFMFTLIIFTLESIAKVVLVMIFDFDQNVFDMSPIPTLVIIAMVYGIATEYYEKKFGDEPDGGAREDTKKPNAKHHK